MPDHDSTFFYQEIDVTNYFINGFYKRINDAFNDEIYLTDEFYMRRSTTANLSDKNISKIRKIKIKSLTFDTILNSNPTSVCLCVYRLKIKVMSMVSLSIVFDIITDTNSDKQTESVASDNTLSGTCMSSTINNNNTIKLSATDYENDPADIKCPSLCIKGIFIQTINKFKDEILELYNDEGRRSELFNTGAEGGYPLDSGEEKIGSKSLKLRADSEGGKGVESLTKVATSAYNKPSTKQPGSINDTLSQNTHLGALPTPSSDTVNTNSSIKGKKSITKYQLSTSTQKYLRLILDPKFVNCYSPVLSHTEYNIKFKEYEISLYMNKGLTFNNILSLWEAYNVEERNSQIELEFIIYENNIKYKVQICTDEYKNLVLIIFADSNQNTEWIKEKIIKLPCEFFKINFKVVK
ncbi:hypothetical protein CDIK_1409 [Cucumispora dikerogammari]|nr:hypothetical protein CDIK_1409 [Cucumispora dikerogammari]